MVRRGSLGSPFVAWKALPTVILAGLLLASCAPKSTKAGAAAPTQKQVTFEGRITNKRMTPVVLRGLVVYDKDCAAATGQVCCGDPSHELIECNGGIGTKDFGLLNFFYVHNMSVDDCLAPGDEVQVDIGKDNAARVQRVAATSGSLGADREDQPATAESSATPAQLSGARIRLRRKLT